MLQQHKAFCADMFLKKVEEDSKIYHTKASLLMEQFLDYGKYAEWRNYILLHNFLSGPSDILIKFHGKDNLFTV